MERSIKWKGLTYLALIICLAASFLILENRLRRRFSQWRFQTHWACLQVPPMLPSEIPWRGGKGTHRWPTVHWGSSGRYVLSPHKECLIYPMPGQRIRSREVRGGVLTGYSHVPLTAVDRPMPALGFRGIVGGWVLSLPYGLRGRFEERSISEKGLCIGLRKFFHCNGLQKTG